MAVRVARDSSPRTVVRLAVKPTFRVEPIQAVSRVVKGPERLFLHRFTGVKGVSLGTNNRPLASGILEAQFIDRERQEVTSAVWIAKDSAATARLVSATTS